MLLAGDETAAVERCAPAAGEEVPPGAQVAALLAAYTLAMFAFYSLVPLVLRWSGAAVLNLSLLSSNLWAALARALLLGQGSSHSSF